MTEHPGQPKYLHIAAELRRAISAGTYPVGSELPSTAKLTETYGVSTTAVRAAVRELQSEGLVRGHAGKAVYVTALPSSAPAGDRTLEARVQELTENVRNLDRRLAALEREAHGHG